MSNLGDSVGDGLLDGLDGGGDSLLGGLSSVGGGLLGGLYSVGGGFLWGGGARLLSIETLNLLLGLGDVLPRALVSVMVCEHDALCLPSRSGPSGPSSSGRAWP